MKINNPLLVSSTLAASLLVLSGPALAASDLNVGDVLGTDEAAITSALEEKGFTVMEVETEDDVLEAEAELDGVEYEFEVSMSDGTILEIDSGDESETDQES